MCQRTALKFIPLLTPFRSEAPDRSYAPFPPESPVPSIDDEEFCSDSGSICSMADNASQQHDDSLSSVNEIFSVSEIAYYSKHKEGYDLKTDLRHNFWLSLQSGTPLPKNYRIVEWHPRSLGLYLIL